MIFFFSCFTDCPRNASGKVLKHTNGWLAGWLVKLCAEWLVGRRGHLSPPVQMREGERERERERKDMEDINNTLLYVKMKNMFAYKWTRRWEYSRSSERLKGNCNASALSHLKRWRRCNLYRCTCEWPLGRCVGSVGVGHDTARPCNSGRQIIIAGLQQTALASAGHGSAVSGRAPLDRLLHENN